MDAPLYSKINAVKILLTNNKSQISMHMQHKVKMQRISRWSHDQGYLRWTGECYSCCSRSYLSLRVMPVALALFLFDIFSRASLAELGNCNPLLPWLALWPGPSL